MKIINYIEELIDNNFLDEYKYVTKEQFLLFVNIHIDKILGKIDISDVDFRDYFPTNKTEQVICDALKSSIELHSILLKEELKEEDLDTIIYELVKRKVYADSIDNIILLEEITYIPVQNLNEKLKSIYLYLLELEIYNYYSIEKLKWKNEKQKQFVLDRVKYSSLLQMQIKQEFIENGSINVQDNYIYNKTIGMISTYPIREIVDKYDEHVLMDVYKIKYLLTLDSKLKKCSDNKLLVQKNETIKNEHKDFFKEIIDKYKALIAEKDSIITRIEKDNSALKNKNEAYNKTIKDYADSIDKYNNLSWFERLKTIFSKDSIKLLK